MTHSNITRIVFASFALALMVLASSADAALNAHLQLKGTNGKTYKVTPDATGKFTFDKVEAGTYELRLVGSAEYFQAQKDEHKGTINIESFSWGVSNMGSGGHGGGAGAGKSTQPLTATGTFSDGTSSDITSERKITKSRSNIQNNRVAIGDVNADGKGDYYKVVLQDILITGITSPTGQIQGMAINTKGTPGSSKK